MSWPPEWVQSVPGRPGFDQTLPTVLIAHLHVSGAQVRSLYRISPRDDVVMAPAFLQATWAYVALGHIHQAQHLPGMTQMRYSGPLDRLDFGEREDERGVWLVDIGPTGLHAEPQWLPLEPTAMLDLTVTSAEDLAAVIANPQRETAIVRVTVSECGLPRDDVSRTLRGAFPRLHEVRWADDSPTVPNATTGPERTYCTANTAGTVRTYLERELHAEHPNRQALLDLADHFLAEEAAHDPAAR